MANFKKAALKMGVIGLAVYAGYAWVNQTPAHAEAVGAKVHHIVDVSTEKADNTLLLIEETVDEKSALMSEKIEKLGVAEKVNDFQQEVAPLGVALKRKLNPNNIPGVNAARWADKNTSFLAIFLMLVAAASIGLIAFASPSPINRR